MIGGDCTVDYKFDRNHEEPHSGSTHVLKTLINRYNLVDLWRDARVKQYTWWKVHLNNISSGRLDRFYTDECSKGRFFW